MSRIRLITLDLDNTLWDVDSIIIKAEQELVQWLTDHVPDSLVHYHPDNLNEIRTAVFAAHQHQAHDLSFMRTQVLFEVMQRTGLNVAEARRMAEQAFDVFFEGRNRVVFFPGALEMLGTVSERFPIYALTNGNANIDKAGLGEFLSGAYSSADVGTKKPQPEMFYAPLKELDLQPQQAIHIGDHLVDDIQGAANVGMHSIWVNLTQQNQELVDVAPTREVSDLLGVNAAVEQISST
jgi:HAD superfamily hydrolase (TIGR01509 family)